MTRRMTGKRSGQAIIMVTLALIAMFGLIGLAVDLGWAHFVRKSARAAADAAALAAVKQAYANLAWPPTYSCTSDMACGTVQCPEGLATPTNNLENGCLYAKRNGFTHGGLGGRQDVSLTGSTDSPFETGTGPVVVHYRATATVRQRIPQLFSAILGNTLATVSATATAAILDMDVPGSLILINRQRDRTAMRTLGGGGVQYGVNLMVQANTSHTDYSLHTDAGIRMASECNGILTGLNTCTNNQNQIYYAGEAEGASVIYSPDIRIRATGWYDTSGKAQWLPRDPTNGYSNGFDDPMAGKGQPPWNPSEIPLPPVAVTGGNITPGFCQGLSGTLGTCTPGKYFAATEQGIATGNPLTISGNVTFSNNGTGFGSYVFYGGLKGASAVVTFEPGVYTLAGVRASNNGPGVLLDTATNFSLIDGTDGPVQNADPGELFILTDGTYGGRIPPPAEISGVVGLLEFGTANFQSGNNTTEIDLHGLNPQSTNVPDALKTYSSTLVWWDRDNSSVRHYTDGNIDVTSCGATQDGLAVDINNPCRNDSLTHDGSPELSIGASSRVNLYGIISQPRGSWTSMIGGDGYTGPIQLITGALHVQAGSKVRLMTPEYTATITVVALIQ